MRGHATDEPFAKRRLRRLALIRSQQRESNLHITNHGDRDVWCHRTVAQVTLEFVQRDVGGVTQELRDDRRYRAVRRVRTRVVHDDLAEHAGGFLKPLAVESLDDGRHRLARCECDERFTLDVARSRVDSAS